MADTEQVKLWSAFDGTKGRPEGTVYLDMVERQNAERMRAVAEGRKPNLDDLGQLPAATGTVLVIDAYRVDNSLYANTAVGSGAFEPREVDHLTVAEVPVEAAAEVDLSLAAQQASERTAQDQALVDATNEQRAKQSDAGKAATDSAAASPSTSAGANAAPATPTPAPAKTEASPKGKA